LLFLCTPEGASAHAAGAYAFIIIIVIIIIIIMIIIVNIIIIFRPLFLGFPFFFRSHPAARSDRGLGDSLNLPSSSYSMVLS